MKIKTEQPVADREDNNNKFEFDNIEIEMSVYKSIVNFFIILNGLKFPLSTFHKNEMSHSFS